MYYKRKTEARSRNHCCLGKAINIRYSECVCSTSYLHAECRRRIVLSSVASPAVPHFSMNFGQKF
jgi:hypothetical protein